MQGGTMAEAGFWIHPDAIVETEDIGARTRIWAFCHLMPGVVIGKDCNVGEHVFVETGAHIGNYVTIKNGVQVWEGITLEDDVFVGPNAVFLNDRYPRSPRSEAAGNRYAAKDWLEETVVRKGASIGGNATLMCGVEIGRYAVVGAETLVTATVPDYALVVGVPGKVKGWACICGRPLRGQAPQYACSVCGRTYVETDGVLAPRAATGEDGSRPIRDPRSGHTRPV